MEKTVKTKKEEEHKVIVCDFCGVDMEEYTLLNSQAPHGSDSRYSSWTCGVSFRRIDLHFACFEKVMKAAKKVASDLTSN